ncbi:hypothetical protein [Methylovorus mays]|uniref:hypothetical protein n=1 Tax=Methylovorus mays TaxID=184077 RepID=UPI001E5D850E|nr:hypothetical protein [Methylovorus mays]MCB5207307.1 hypothetical protein [Methylovorus mays]
MKLVYWALPAALLLPACVTINIYFPAAAAEKAADRIIDDVWQLQDKKAAPTAPAGETPAVQPAP